MNLSKNANARLWDALLKELLIEDLNSQLREFSGDNAPSTSGNFDRKIAKIARSVGRKEAAKNLAKAAKTCAVTAAFVISVGFGLLLTQPSVYAAVGDVFRTAISGGFDKYTFSGDSGEFELTAHLGYTPEGYELRHADFADSFAALTYEDTDGDRIEFEYGKAANSSFSVDNERHEHKEVAKNCAVYHLYLAKEEGDWNTVIWQKDGRAFCIDAHFDGDELVKIAENVEF